MELSFNSHNTNWLFFNGYFFRSIIEWTEDRDENQPPSFLERHKDKLPVTISAALANLKMMPSHLKENLTEFCQVKFF